METASARSRHDVTDFELLVEGKDVSKDYQVVSINVNNEVNAVASARIILRDGEASKEKFELSDKPDFLPGQKIKLSLGDDDRKQAVFEGAVVKHAIRAKGEQSSFLTIDCRHNAVKMTLGRKNKYYADLKDSDLIEKLMGNYGLKSAVDTTDATHKEMVQFNCTDWDYMVSRAEVNGLLVFAEGAKLQAKRPVVDGSSVAVLHYGQNLIEFEAEMDARTQWKTVKSSAWNFKDQALFESSTSSVPLTEAGNVSGSQLANKFAPDEFELRHTGRVKQEELKAWAVAAMLKSRLAKIRGTGKIKGDAAIKPGVTVELAGCGNRFNGKVYVTGVRHEVASGSWFTIVQFGLTPDWFSQKPDIMLPPAGGLTPPLHGLQIGIVTQLENDPDGENRILVKLPLLDNGAKGIWSRVSTLDAGSERGTFFLPEIGDEVLVGFLNDDPRDAVVLGMMHSSAKPAHVDAKDDNHIKGYQSRSKLQLMFDDEKKIITIKTPAGNQFLMDEDEKAITLKDQHGNLLKMSQNGIEIKSIKDLKIESAQNTDLKAGQNLKQEGSMNAELKAGMALKANGGAQAEFSSGGVAQLKGAMVQIN